MVLIPPSHCMIFNMRETVTLDHVRFRWIAEQWLTTPLGRGKKPDLSHQRRTTISCIGTGGYTYQGNCLVVEDWRVPAENSGSDSMDLSRGSFWESGWTMASAGNYLWDACAFYDTEGVNGCGGVAKQLEAAMGDLNERLQMEKRRAEEATLEIYNLPRDYWSVMVIVAPEFIQELPQAIPHWSLMRVVLRYQYLTPLFYRSLYATFEMMESKYEILLGLVQVSLMVIVAPEFQELPQAIPHLVPILVYKVCVQDHSHLVLVPFSKVYLVAGPQVGATLAYWVCECWERARAYSSTTPEGNLLATLARSIETLLQQQQQGGKSDRPETVKPGITDLPSLPEYQPTTGSIDLLNWLTHIQPIMQDLSDTSYAWWEATLQEKALVLQKLERPDTCETALQAVEALRKWSLWRRRAASIGIAEPDASVLIQGLDRITTKVDVCPSSQSVTTFLQHLQAEMEQQDCKAPGGALAKTARAMGSGPGETGSTSPTSSAPEVGQRKVNFEDEVIQTKVLKLLAEVQGIPLFRSVTERIQGWRDGFFSITKARPALLDSGATHVLRAPHNEEEWNEAADVSVKLAGDATTTMRQTSTGSLLSSDQLAQVIVPLGKVIATLGYELNWTSRSCELVGPNGEVLPLVVKNGCPEIGQKAAARLIQQLEEEQVAQLEDATQASQKALRTLKASWWSYLQEYVRTHDPVEACAAVDKAFFLDYKDDVKRLMVTKTPRNSIWEMLKNLCVNRRGRKKLMKAHSWVLRWDPPTVDRPRDALKHLSYIIGNMVYVNMSILLIENEFEDVWRVVQWAALTGRISTMVARDGTGTPLDKVIAGPHRSKFHFLHALASASRELFGGGVVTLYVEIDAQQYFEEMGLMNVSVTQFEGDRTARLAKLNSDAEWRLHEDEEIEIDYEHGEGDVDGPGRAGVSPEEIEEEERRWKELLATFKEPIATTTLYFVVPVNNKRAATMLPAVQKIVMDVKALGYPITRLHSDRGGEFRGNLVRKWALGQGMWPTTTSGSDSAANGVAESGVRFIKRRARVLLDTAGIAKENWPTAVQYAAAQQRADQLGVLPSMPVAYGTKVYVKTKRYKTGAVEDFGPHWTRGQYVGPSSDIRGGHVILKDTGTFIQTTHVRVTRDPPPLEEV
ncbi:GIP, partial [Symbiodinium necroappetens]